jgi:hypothetical protein
MPRVYAENQINKAVELVKRGRSCSEAAREVGLPNYVVLYWCRRTKAQITQSEQIKQLRDEVLKKLNLDQFTNVPIIADQSLVSALVSIFMHMRSDPSCPPLARSDFVVACSEVMVQHRGEGIPYYKKEDGVTSPLGNFSMMLNRLLEQQSISGFQKCEFRPTIFVRDYFTKHNNPEVAKRAEELCVMVVKNHLHNGRSPKGVAASIIYLSYAESGNRITEQEIANRFNISVVSVRKNYKLIMKCPEYIQPSGMEMGSYSHAYWYKPLEQKS